MIRRLKYFCAAASFLYFCINLYQTGEKLQPYIAADLHNEHDQPKDMPDVQRKDVTDDPNKDITVFYNVFIPQGGNEIETQANINKTLEIVKEQLLVRKASPIANSTLYYVLIGAYVEKLPNCTNCKLLEHHREGSENVILEKIHDFCKNHTEKRVAYIHDKGSYHPSHENDLYRRMVTKAVFSDECQFSSSECNVCGARFSLLPHFHIPGNMWVADCSYVSKLLQPYYFQSKMNDIFRDAPLKKFVEGKELTADFTGRDRFSAEHWLCSHPSIRPCDVYPEKSYYWGFDNLPKSNDWNPSLKKAPRFPSMAKFDTFLGHLKKYDEVNWFHLEGRIYEWKNVYGQLPGNNSWIWDYYKYGSYLKLIFKDYVT